MITVVLVEDHPQIRRAARRLLNAAAGILVVGEAENGRQALVLVPELQPDVVVMDVVMPELNGLPKIKVRAPAGPSHTAHRTLCCTCFRHRRGRSTTCPPRLFTRARYQHHPLHHHPLQTRNTPP
jgi:response regulator RpfG family c-di-GMP phosphodiesterase